MLFTVILSYLPYAVVTTFTPGPNTLLSLYAVSQKGWRRGKNTLFGITAGFLCIMLLCAGFCYELNRYVPALAGVLKYVGAVYIFWLAFHIAVSKPEKQEEKNSSFWQGFFLQFANVKVILYAITVYTGYVLTETTSAGALFVHALFLTFLGFAGVITWGAAGGILQKFLAKYYRPFHLLMALILVICGIKLL